MRFSEILSPSFWANIWIDYARFDDAYVQPVSAGFNIDVGNGHTTLLPSLFLLASMVRPLADAKARRAEICLAHAVVAVVPYFVPCNFLYRESRLGSMARTSRERLGLFYGGPKNQSQLLYPCCHTHAAAFNHAGSIAF